MFDEDKITQLVKRLRKIGKMCFGTTSGNLDFQTTQEITFSDLIPSEFCPIDHVNRFAYSAFIAGKVVAGYIQICRDGRI